LVRTAPTARKRKLSAQNLNIQAEIKGITDMGQMMIHDILATPARVINEKVVQPRKDSDCCGCPGLVCDGAVTAENP
jgi:hypothetical protein